MIQLEFYLTGDDRMDDMLAHVRFAENVPAKGSVVMLHHQKGDGYRRYRVDEVEYWFDVSPRTHPDTIHSAVIVVTPEPEAA